MKLFCKAVINLLMFFIQIINIDFCLSDNMCLQNPPVHLGIRHSDDCGRPVRKIWPKPPSTSSLLRTTFAPSEGQSLKEMAQAFINCFASVDIQSESQ